MKIYVVKVLKYFKDKEEKKERNVGDEFETTKERYEFLKRHNAVELVEIVDVEGIIPLDEETMEKVAETIGKYIEEVEEQEEKPKKKKSSKK